MNPTAAKILKTIHTTIINEITNKYDAELCAYLPIPDCYKKTFIVSNRGEKMRIKFSPHVDYSEITILNHHREVLETIDIDHDKPVPQDRIRNLIMSHWGKLIASEDTLA
jgi:hypothetical protein